MSDNEWKTDESESEESVEERKRRMTKERTQLWRKNNKEKVKKMNRISQQKRRAKDDEQSKIDSKISMQKTRAKDPDQSKLDSKISMQKTRAKDPDQSKLDSKISMQKSRDTLLPEEKRKKQQKKDRQKFHEELAKAKFDKWCLTCHELKMPHERKEFQGDIYCNRCFKQWGGLLEFKTNLKPKYWKIWVDQSVDTPGPCTDRHPADYTCNYCHYNPALQKKVDSAIENLENIYTQVQMEQALQTAYELLQEPEIKSNGDSTCMIADALPCGLMPCDLPDHSQHAPGLHEDCWRCGDIEISEKVLEISQQICELLEKQDSRITGGISLGFEDGIWEEAQLEEKVKSEEEIRKQQRCGEHDAASDCKGHISETILKYMCRTVEL